MNGKSRFKVSAAEPQDREVNLMAMNSYNLTSETNVQLNRLSVYQKNSISIWMLFGSDRKLSIEDS